MITVPIIVTWIAGGAAAAFGGWLFHKVVKDNRQLSTRVEALEAPTEEE